MTYFGRGGEGLHDLHPTLLISTSLKKILHCTHCDRSLEVPKTYVDKVGTCYWFHIPTISWFKIGSIIAQIIPCGDGWGRGGGL